MITGPNIVPKKGNQIQNTPITHKVSLLLTNKQDQSKQSTKKKVKINFITHLEKRKGEIKQE